MWMPNELTVHFFQLSKGTNLLFKTDYLSEGEYVAVCLCHHISVLVHMHLYISFPAFGSHTTKCYSMLKT